MKPLAFILLSALSFAMVGCKPATPPSSPFPTKENTIDKVKADVDKAMKKAEEMRDAEDPTKKGY